MVGYKDDVSEMKLLMLFIRCHTLMVHNWHLSQSLSGQLCFQMNMTFRPLLENNPAHPVAPSRCVNKSTPPKACSVQIVAELKSA